MYTPITPTSLQRLGDKFCLSYLLALTRPMMDGQLNKEARTDQEQ